ncbi:hypothetical protein Tdes44962_MAKER00270 [Teratosphaeria destructans]|uniref:Rhodopsin domain-containing protein n=1 Tax=Teratosphaeria destructans TaxID=418781 RepID=A0A9W7W4E4_9PEZI|nr:hypothetical protein Tdes44962_MAKER00270 [Teratosphaeria destructans]
MSSAGPAPYVEGPRHAVVTPQDHGAVLSIAAWFLMVTMILTASLRFSIRFLTSHIPGWDDAALLVALIFGIMEVIAVSVSVNLGLGKRGSLLPDEQREDVSKCLYGATLLYIFTLTLSKVSVAILINRLATLKRHVLAIKAMMVLVVVWTVAASLGVAFRCGPETPWKVLAPTCNSTMASWAVLGTVDMLIDGILMILPTWIVWDLQMSRDKKITVASAFAFQILPIVAQLVRLMYLSQMHHSHDRTYDAIFYVTATQCHMSLSLISCSVPALKPFMDVAATGFMGATINLSRSHLGSSQPRSSGYAMRSLSKRNYVRAQSAGTDCASAQHMANSLTKSCPTKNRTMVLAAQVNGYDGDPDSIERSVEVEVQYSDESDEARLYPSERFKTPSDAVSTETSQQDADDLCRNAGSSAVSTA